MITEEMITTKFNNIRYTLNERSRRIWAATEALAYGKGGIVLVKKATGISRVTITKGIKEIQNPDKLDSKRMRSLGGGRKSISEKIPTLNDEITKLIEPDEKGDPISALKWISKSTYKINDALTEKKIKVSQRTVCNKLHELGYSLQGNRKEIEGISHVDRDSQFKHINEICNEFIKNNQPIISVDTKKKENIGNFKNNGKEYHKKGEPTLVNVHDFVDKELGKVAPYGVYDIGKDLGLVNVGINNDTSEFAVESIRYWCTEIGQHYYPDMKELLITADCGGSNGYRVRLWKTELQKLAQELGISIMVCHYPPGNSKWNKIEHRLFSYITSNWRGIPLLDTATVIELISHTSTKKGLVVKARLDERIYQKGIKVSDEELAKVNIARDEFHGEWNYTISPIEVVV